MLYDQTAVFETATWGQLVGIERTSLSVAQINSSSFRASLAELLL